MAEVVANQKRAAEILGVSVTTFWRMRREGLVKQLEQYRSPRFSVAELKQMTTTKAQQQ